jgi:serine/threonine protein kinase/Flp pilus assembly protein TadD
MIPQAKPSSENLSAELAELVERLNARLQAGEPFDPEQVLRDHPEYAEELRKLLPTMADLAELSWSPSSGPAREISAIALGDLGDYHLIHEVGRGGMGVVYEAEQVSLGRRVALKVLPYAATMDPKQLQRFKNEARAAASLKHEHIVPIYAVGCERGVHYYAMEFVEGQTLAQLIAGIRPNRASNEHRRLDEPREDETPAYPVVADAPSSPAPDTAAVAALSTQFSGPRNRQFYRQAAELIAQAADALEYAHSLGIVHRDVKPANLLLDGAGKLYVSDFGLARFGSDADLTMTGDIIGTLRYMSPEQALAKHGLVDHRTDIYSLGATLYEVLTLRPAMDGADKQEILKKIAFEEPLAPRSLDRTIPGELETIALKALAKEPAERYATAGDLASDLRRWLDDLTIKARPPGLRQRVAKWTRRHPGVTATAGVSAALLLGLVIAGLGVNNALIQGEQKRTQDALNLAVESERLTQDALNRAVESERRTQTALDLAFQSANRMLFDIADAVADAPGLEETQRKVVQSAVSIYEGLGDYKGNAPEVERDRGQAQFRLGMIHDRLGDLKRGGAAYTRAAEIYRTLAESDRNNAVYRYWQACSLAEHGDLCDRLGNGMDAENLARQAYLLFQAAEKDFPDDVLIRAGLADCCLVLASVNFFPGPRMNNVYSPYYPSHNTRQWPECDGLLRRALKLYPGIIEKDPDQSDHRWRYHRTQKVLSQMPNLPFAKRVQLANDGVAGFESAIEKFPQQPRPRAELCEALGWRGALWEAAGRPAEAEAAHRRAVEIADKLVVDYPKVPYYSTLRASARGTLGRFLADLDQLKEAKELLTEAAKTLATTPEGHVPTWQLRNQAARCYQALGIAQDQAGRLHEAEEAHRQALVLDMEAARDHMNSEVLLLINRDKWRLSSVLRRKGSIDDGIELHRAAINFWKGQAKLHPASAMLQRAPAWSLVHLGYFLRASGRVTEADQAYCESVDIHIRFEESGIKDNWERANHGSSTVTQMHRAWLHANVGDLDRAEDVCREIVRRADKKRKAAPQATPGPRHDFALANVDLGRFLDAIGRRPASIVAYQEAIGELDRLAAEFADERRYADHAADSRMKLAFVYQRDGNTNLANRVADQAITSERGRPNAEKHRPVLAWRLAELAMVRGRTGRVEDAMAATGEAVAIMDALLAEPAPAAAPRRKLQALMAFVTNRHAYLLEQAGRFAEAEAAYAKSVALRRHLAETAAIGEWFGNEEVDDYQLTRERLIYDLMGLAWFHLRRGQAEQAASLCAEGRNSLQGIVDAYPADPYALNELAWFLVTCPVEAVRDPERAVRHARKAIAQREHGDFVGTLGAAQYRAGHFRAAVANLDLAARTLDRPGLQEVYFRAMARWRLGESEAARRHYEEGIRGEQRLPPDDIEQRRAEAAAVLGIK